MKGMEFATAVINCQREGEGDSKSTKRRGMAADWVVTIYLTKMINIPLINFKSSTSVVSIKFAFSKPIWRAIRLIFLLFLLISFLFYLIRQFNLNHSIRLILITPTHMRTERLADLTRLSQTLMHVDNLDWILIEDGPKRVDSVERILKRSKIPYKYLVKKTEPGYPGRGWPQRNFALDFVRKNYANYKEDAVIYFLDDDNTYDLRLFQDYLPKVKTIGLWAVGLVRFGFIEAPRVKNAKIVGWDSWKTPVDDVKFVIDMAGFGIHLNLIRKHNASFHRECSREYPEDCFLRQFHIPPSLCQPFGYDSRPKEVLVWHTKTYSLGTNGSTFGYIIADEMN